MLVTQAQTFTFKAIDGTPLAGALFKPGGVPRSAVLIAGGLGIPQGFYTAFASWLARRGHVVMSFDLRGMGASRLSQRLEGLDIDMLGWARLDFAAAVRHLVMLNGGLQITLIGHSLGMHHAAMTDAATQACISRVVSVAAGTGYWKDWAPRSRRLAPLMLHLAGPLLTPLFGYFPGKRLGMVGDLPAPVMRQWTRWCRHPGFAWGAEPAKVSPSLQSARFAITAFSFTDDDAMTRSCTCQLLAALPNASSKLRVVSPADVGLEAIGHVGAFRRAAEAALWPMLEAAVLDAPR
jgi:predicted alpha/beta hydrolase